MLKMWSTAAFKQRTGAKETNADSGTADSQCYEADTKIRDFILHLATRSCWDLSCHEIVSILHCALSQPSINSFCFHHQEYSALPATESRPMSCNPAVAEATSSAERCQFVLLMCAEVTWLKHSMCSESTAEDMENEQMDTFILDPVCCIYEMRTRLVFNFKVDVIFLSL